MLIVLVGHIAVFGPGLGLSRLGPFPPLGVDLFFVLSGFLITNVLLHSRHGSRYYLNFYARRALRIWPLYALLLFFMFVIANHHIQSLSFNDSQISWPYFALFVQNIVYPRPALLGPLALAVTWSVAVEEQFYAVWPILVRTLSRRQIVWILLLIIVAAPLARLGANLVGIDPYINPLCRFDGMALGSLVALWMSTRTPSAASLKWASRLFLLAAAAGAAVSWVLGLEHLLDKTFVAMGFCGLLVAALVSPTIARVLSLRPLRHFGRISYGIYLIHLPIETLTASLLPDPGWQVRIARSVLIFAGSIGAATVSWYCFESRILRLKRFFTDSQSVRPIQSNSTVGLAVDDPVRQTA